MEVKEEEETKKTIPTAKKLILETMEVDLEMKDSIFCYSSVDQSNGACSRSLLDGSG